MSEPENGLKVSILLPTTERTEVVDQILEQISDRDEFLIICDKETDHVNQSSDDFPENTHVIIAGEPQNCSGKANAIYHGMKKASNDVVVWTDGDFDHDGWLDEMKSDYLKNGNTSELPFLVGYNPFAVLKEPIYALVMLVTYLNNQCWGGSVIFDRNDMDEERFLDELSNTIGDDVLLSEHLKVKTLRRTRDVGIDKTSRHSLERISRFVKNVRYHEPLQTVLLSGVSILISLACIMYPLYAFTATTGIFLGIYAFLGYRRPTFLLAYPALTLLPVFLAYGFLRKTFVWHGRRYLQKSKFNVEILER